MKIRIVLGVLVVASMIVYVRWSRFFMDRDGEDTDPVEMITTDIDPGLLIQRSLDAHGGAEFAESLETLQLESSIKAYDGDGNAQEGLAVEYYRFPDRVRSDVVIGVEKIIQLYDGRNAWTIREGQRTRGADYIAEGRRRGVKHVPILLIHSALNERSILGTVQPDSLNHRRMYVMNLIDAEGDQTRLWLDAQSFLLARLDYTLYSSLGAIPVRVMMGNYRVFDGVQTATHVDFYYNDEITQETRVNSASYNPILPDTLFAFPPE